jgi:hypothetical protein
MLIICISDHPFVFPDRDFSVTLAYQAASASRQYTSDLTSNPYDILFVSPLSASQGSAVSDDATEYQSTEQIGTQENDSRENK